VAELLGKMKIDGRKVKKTPNYIIPPRYTDDGKNMDCFLCKMRKGTYSAPNSKNWLTKNTNDHTRIYTEGSKKEEKVGYVVVTDQQSTRRRIRDQSSLISAEQEAIIGAIQKLPTTGVRGVIFTDSLSTMMAASGNNHTKNCQLMDKRKGNVTLCWEIAKQALKESIPNDEKYPPDDLSGWIKM
jgi:hypothetical protein